MTPLETKLVEAARGMVGTPFRRGARNPPYGLDCSGLLVCAGRAAGVPLRDRPRVRPEQWAQELQAALGEVADPVPKGDLRPGLVVLMDLYGTGSYHAGIVSSLGTDLGLIHAVHGPRGMVVEHGLDAHWRAKITHAYRVRGRT